MTRSDPRHRAVLLLGPTGAGKTPLGQVFESQGLWGQRCVHFDFGANLRAIVLRDEPDEHVTRDDIDFLKHVLQTGALLEDAQFPLARRILESFLAARQVDVQTRIVLNGLPRHAGQAEAVDGLLHVEAVIELACDAETVVDRIRSNVGGDRAERSDDDPASVRGKLEIFARRTAPLVEHYRTRNARIVTVGVGSTMTPREVWRIVENA